MWGEAPIDETEVVTGQLVKLHGIAAAWTIYLVRFCSGAPYFLHGHDVDQIGLALESAVNSGLPTLIQATTQRCAGLPAPFSDGPEKYGEGLTENELKILAEWVSAP